MPNNSPIVENQAERERYIVKVCDRIFWNEMARAPEDRVPLTRATANELLFSCLLNRSINWEKAMGAVDIMLARSGYSDALRMLLELPLDAIEDIMFTKPAVHRYRYMAGYLKGCAEHLQEHHDGDTRKMWGDEPTAHMALGKLIEIKGIGLKTGNLFLRIAVLGHGVRLWDSYAGINISVDRHVHRVGVALGLWDEDASVEEIESVARRLNPMCPVSLDALFVIHEWHGSGVSPTCTSNEDGRRCPMFPVCPSRR